MAQGKLKVKAKLPENTKSRKQQRKGTATTKRANCPIKPKKRNFEETHKLKQVITKTVNKAVEEEIRAKAGTQQKMSQAQEAVANYNTKAGSST